MKERPIVFSSESVRAILEGRKTQTRRVIKNVAGYEFKGMDGHMAMFGYPDSRLCVLRHCPQGVPGDRLWVRECFGFTAKWTMSYQRQWLTERAPWLPGNIMMAYRADEPEGNWCWKPSIHMPKIYSRITLEIANIRVERLQDISEDDAMAEGVEPIIMDDVPYYLPSFVNTWNRINAGRGYGWDTNPWVFVIEFQMNRGTNGQGIS